jgi:phosphomethylpyrimidine synthase
MTASGPWGDPRPSTASPKKASLPCAKNGSLARNDVIAYDGREVKPQDNGYLTGKHAEFASTAERNRLVEFPEGLHGERRRPLKATGTSRHPALVCQSKASSPPRWSSSPSARI